MRETPAARAAADSPAWALLHALAAASTSQQTVTRTHRLLLGFRIWPPSATALGYPGHDDSCVPPGTSRSAVSFLATLGNSLVSRIMASLEVRKLITRAWHLLTDAEHAAASQPAAPQTAAR